MVQAGEASGKLDGVLRAIVEDRTRRELLGERINSTIRYPLFLIGAAVLILLFFLTYVVPQFEAVFHDLGNRLNPGAAFVLAASAGCTRISICLSGRVSCSCSYLVDAARPRAEKPDRRALGQASRRCGPMRDRRTARLTARSASWSKTAWRSGRV